MIRQLKSIKQIEALLVADINNSKASCKMMPKVVITVPTAPDQCNWDVVEWAGTSKSSSAIFSTLSIRVAEMQRRYNAILPRSS